MVHPWRGSADLMGMADIRSRRTVLLAATGSLVLATTACAEEPTPRATPTAEGDPTATASGPLAYLTDLPTDQPVSARAADGTPLLLVRIGPTQVRGLDARCTHRGCVVELIGAELACPCHNSRFEPTTGDRIRGVAPTGLRPFPVRVQDGAVLPD
jgi:nitrite reductase/ring-hydroxylating ferredoxin subunit